MLVKTKFSMPLTQLMIKLVSVRESLREHKETLASLPDGNIQRISHFNLLARWNKSHHSFSVVRAVRVFLHIGENFNLFLQ